MPTLKETKIGRRDAVRRLLLLPSVAVPAWFAAGCKGGNAPLTCNDTSALAPDDLKARVVTFAYVDASPDPKKKCSVCAQFRPGPPGQCGGCSIVKGPINPAGSCNSFTPKPA